MCATVVVEPVSHLPILCGFFMANDLTGPATRRSELPSRSTGFTAEPSTLAYRAAASFSASVLGLVGKSGTAKPCDWSSAMAALSCGIDALTLGSLTMLAAGVLARSPSAESSSLCCCSLESSSENDARMRPETEMSAVSMAMPAGLAKRWMTGSSAYEASAGASSVWVQMILFDELRVRRRVAERRAAPERFAAVRCSMPGICADGGRFLVSLGWTVGRFKAGVAWCAL